LSLNPVLYARFFKAIAEVHSCWVWTGRRDRSGYGQMRVKGREYRAHRISFLIFNPGADMHGQMVLHSCDNPRCVNPAHLSLGDGKENSRQCVERNRQAKGSRVPSSKLDESEALEIRALVEAGMRSADVMRAYGITRNAIDCLINRVTWKHV
jgi:hypothetical protein